MSRRPTFGKLAPLALGESCDIVIPGDFMEVLRLKPFTLVAPPRVGLSKPRNPGLTMGIPADLRERTPTCLASPRRQNRCDATPVGLRTLPPTIHCRKKIENSAAGRAEVEFIDEFTRLKN